MVEKFPGKIFSNSLFSFLILLCDIRIDSLCTFNNPVPTSHKEPSFSIGQLTGTFPKRARLLLRLDGGGGYDFYGKDSQQLGTSENFTAISRIPSWDSEAIIVNPKDHTDWLRITAHQKEVSAMLVICFEGQEYLISADNYGVMLVWETETWKCVRELCGHRSLPAPSIARSALPPPSPASRYAWQSQA